MNRLNFKGRVVSCILLGGLLLGSALWIGLMERTVWATVVLVGTSILLEAQPGAVASVPLGFTPVTGAVISILANLVLLPLVAVCLDDLLKRFKWVKSKLQKAEKWSTKYGRYGVWSLVFLSPFLGAYVCTALGVALRWRISIVLLSVFLGMLTSVLLITFGGHGIARFFTP